MSNAVDSRTLAALHWFGYGRWSAPFWFIGMEPGGSDEDAGCDSWLPLGGKELIDCRQHHLDCGFTRWHGGERPATQSTWRRLIQVMLAFEGLPTDLETVRQTQRDSFGTINGNSAVIELSALHARSLREKVDRKQHLQARVEVIAKRMDQHCPQFALFYGQSYRKDYERVTGIRFDEVGMCRRGNTLCLLTPHPTARSRAGSSYWTDAGILLSNRTRQITAEGRRSV